MDSPIGLPLFGITFQHFALEGVQHLQLVRDAAAHGVAHQHPAQAGCGVVIVAGKIAVEDPVVPEGGLMKTHGAERIVELAVAGHFLQRRRIEAALGGMEPAEPLRHVAHGRNHVAAAGKDRRIAFRRRQHLAVLLLAIAGEEGVGQGPVAAGHRNPGMVETIRRQQPLFDESGEIPSRRPFRNDRQQSEAHIGIIRGSGLAVGEVKARLNAGHFRDREAVQRILALHPFDVVAIGVRHLFVGLHFIVGEVVKSGIVPEQLADSDLVLVGKIEIGGRRHIGFGSARHRRGQGVVQPEFPFLGQQQNGGGGEVFGHARHPVMGVRRNARRQSGGQKELILPVRHIKGNADRGLLRPLLKQFFPGVVKLLLQFILRCAKRRRVGAAGRQPEEEGAGGENSGGTGQGVHHDLHSVVG
ncbi:hypothetical protein SDC9_93906 [bioreactor metagenome]|uniref:Uncharacterized protein n=1 Tax=bioreactor metagenome TaxID=1076179 RepID=A0A645A3A3_9ZZZZ